MTLGGPGDLGDLGATGAAWGAVTAVAGLVLAADWRGAAHRIAYRRPTAFGVAGVRWTGAVFAVVGLGVVIMNAGALTDHGIGARIGDWTRSPLSVPWPFLAFISGTAANVLRVLWWSPGPLRRTWRRGGRLCRSALVVQSAAFPAFAVSLGFASKTALLVCCAVGLLATLTVLLSPRTRD
ncbi:hypothetical protein [Streptomyces sp. NPDC003952]